MGSIDVETADECPFRQFEKWFAEATEAELTEPNAMTLSTVDSDGRPCQRTVLLKLFDHQGFVFFTSYDSRKARQISRNPNVSVLFPWIGLQRQVEIGGTVEKVSAVESLRYFSSRPRGSQLGAWVAQQSSVVSARSILQNKLAELKEKFSGGSVPMPAMWGGFRILPRRFEFWQGGRNRLHDRIEYWQPDGQSWQRRRLAP